MEGSLSQDSQGELSSLECRSTEGERGREFGEGPGAALNEPCDSPQYWVSAAEFPAELRHTQDKFQRVYPAFQERLHAGKPAVLDLKAGSELFFIPYWSSSAGRSSWKKISFKTSSNQNNQSAWSLWRVAEHHAWDTEGRGFPVGSGGREDPPGSRRDPSAAPGAFGQLLRGEKESQASRTEQAESSSGRVRALGKRFRLAPKQQPKGRREGLKLYLSPFLSLTGVVLLVIFVSILAVKKIGSDWLNRKEKSCPCQAKQKDMTTVAMCQLNHYLPVQAGNLECENPENLKSKCIWFEAVKDYVINVIESSSKRFDAALHWILYNYRAVTNNLFLFLLSLMTIGGVLIFLKYYWKKEKENEQSTYEMVKRILVVVQDHYKKWEQNLEHYPYISICHVRDNLILPQNRKKMKQVWERAVKFLASNESRVQTELHRVAGEDMLVWRWTQPSPKHQSSS